MNSFTASPGENASSSAPWFTGAKVYDLLAASPLILWYAFCVIQQVPQLLDELAS